MPASMTQPALGCQQENQHSSVDPSKTITTTQQQPTHLLVVAQDYNHYATLFRAPWYQNGPTKRQLDKQIQHSIKPSILARPFMSYIVGTADIIRVASSRSPLPAFAERVVLGDFREDLVLTHELQNRDVSLDHLQSNLDPELLHDCEHTTNSVQGHRAVVIRTVLNKARVATLSLASLCCLVPTLKEFAGVVRVRRA
ncbi:MAG: hypothetical protein Q9184_004296 [Pyrenodesmia sp. 2 TL-2023]